MAHNKLNKILAFASTLPYRLRMQQPELRYHFIHIPKNGGTAVRSALKWRGDVSLSEPRHYRYIDIADQLAPGLRYFSVIRNPWSRTASRYLFARKQSLKWPATDARRRYIQDASFEQFVRESRVLDIPAHPGQPWMGPLNSWFNQLDWIRDRDGSVVCDCLRFENLNEDINRYFDSWMVLPEKKVARKPYDYREMYTDDLVDRVANMFRDDVDHFGFEFEGAASRNVKFL